VLQSQQTPDAEPAVPASEQEQQRELAQIGEPELEPEPAQQPAATAPEKTLNY
jgi:hypothetical protein